MKTIVHVNNTGLPRIKVSDFVVGSQWKQICRGDFCAERFEYTCSSGICDDIFPDGILLSGVEDIAQSTLNESTFLLLHMGGSHGPNYFQKYPNRFSTFEPVCTDKYLPMCDTEELRNAYDNTLIYTVPCWRNWHQSYQGYRGWMQQSFIRLIMVKVCAKMGSTPMRRP